MLAESLIGHGVNVVTGGTDNHLVLVDVRGFGLNGRQAEAAVRGANLTLNRNVIPNDPNGAWYTSGLRLGTPAMTTLGMGADEMDDVADIMATSSATSAQATRAVEGPHDADRAVIDGAGSGRRPAPAVPALRRPDLG